MLGSFPFPFPFPIPDGGLLSLPLPQMPTGELACTYAALLLHDEKIPITAEKISAVLKAANVTVEAYWPQLFAKLLEKKNIGDLISNVGAGARFTSEGGGAHPPRGGGEEP